MDYCPALICFAAAQHDSRLDTAHGRSSISKYLSQTFYKNIRILSIPSYELKSKMTTLHWHLRKFIPCSTIEITASSLRCTASPLLMEKSNILSQTAVTEITHPIGVAKTM